MLAGKLAKNEIIIIIILIIMIINGPPNLGRTTRPSDNQRKKENLSANFKELPIRVEMAPS